MVETTRTLNPLHFEDLEPHRFEDIVRQLIYGKRNWSLIEAVGRSGADQGIDILAKELVFDQGFIPEYSPSEEDKDPIYEQFEERDWVIQCKRQQEIGPSEVKKIIGNFIKQNKELPYGYMLVAACNFSLESRKVFRESITTSGINEGQILGKAELEDLLFLPENDHLLFAYFGISLQIKRRSQRSLFRSRLSIKRKLLKVLGELNSPGFESVLIRNPSDQDYPYIEDHEKFVLKPNWRYWKFQSHQPPDHIAFVSKKYYAYMNMEKDEWDILDDLDKSNSLPKDIFGLDRDWWDPDNLNRKYHAYWNIKIPDENRAWAIELSFIHYDRIIVIDEYGDAYNREPHILVDYVNNSPFIDRKRYYIEHFQNHHILIKEPDEEKRVDYFPEEIPDLHDEWMEKLRKEVDS